MTDVAQLRSRLELLRSLRHRRVSQWWADPVRWCQDLLPGVKLADYQADELRQLAARHRVAVRGPRGSGKTLPAAIALLWFATTREMVGANWQVPTTAGSQAQVAHLWREVRRRIVQIRWDTLGLPVPPWRQELMMFGLQLRFGDAYGRATDDPNLIEGAHADNMLVIIDEGKAVPDGIWDAAEGFFFNPGEHFCYALSTPGAPVGRFSDIHHKRPGFEHWAAIHVTKDEALRAGRLRPDELDQLR